MHITHKDVHEKESFIVSLENMLSHVKVFNAHTIKRVQTKDTINLQHDHNQRHIFIESCQHIQ